MGYVMKSEKTSKSIRIKVINSFNALWRCSMHKESKKNNKKSKKNKENPIPDLEQQPRRCSRVSDDLPAPTMAPTCSEELHDAKKPNPKHCRDRRWPESTLLFIGSLEKGFKTRYGSYPQRRSSAHEY